MRGFAPSEYQRRVGDIQAGMAGAGFAALLLTSEPDVRYVTGFLTRFWESPTRPWFVVVPAIGAPIAVIPEIGVPLMASTWITDIRSWAAPDLADDGVSLLAATLAEQVCGGGTIGLPMGHETHLRMPLADFERLKTALAPRGFADATPVLRRVREVKSEAEIAKIKAACGVADRAFSHVGAMAGPGVPLAQVFRDFQIECLRQGADWVPYLAGGAGPDGYGDVISPANDRALVKGDILMLDTGAVREGYFCDFDRNFAIGAASDAARRAYVTLHAATDAGLAVARPGATAADVFHAMQAVLGADAGGGRLGHGLGLQLTEWPSLIATDQTVLREGMVLTLEPGLEVAPGKIMVFEENIVLRAGGAELLSTRAPATLPVIG